MKATFTLFLLVIFSNNTLKVKAQKANTADSLVLVDLYNSTNGSNWAIPTGWLAGPVSTWAGVTLDSGGRVSSITLSLHNLYGSIPTSIGSLAHLKSLILFGNRLSDSIPASFGNLTNLQNVDFSNNQLSGDIPVSVVNLTNLQNLNLSDNQLSGGIPALLGNLKNLQNLNLSINNLSNSIPTSIGDLTNIVLLNLSRNQLSGGMPTELGNLKNLQNLQLTTNQISGSIPSSLGNLTNLQILSLNDNRLTDTLPSSLGNLINLTSLNLSSNQLSGNMPAALGNLAKLQYLDLGGNQLTGTIPSQMASLTNIYSLGLGNNKLTGHIPSFLGNLTNLTGLSLNNNQLSDTLPSSLGNLKNLSGLFLNDNQLTGNIPTSFGNMVSLTGLYLYNNQLSGNIPSSLGNLTNLQSLYLNNNLLSDSIPALGNLINLEFLYLSNNQLTGVIPASISNLPSLEILELSHNKLSGSIPSSFKSLQTSGELDLSYNYFTFDGMEAIAQKLNSFFYAPQYNIPLHVNNKKLFVNAGGALSNNTYRWYNGSALIKTAIGDSIFTPTVAGEYSAQVSNSVATALILVSDTLTIGDSLILPAKPNSEYASYQYTDTLGWTHYYYDNNTPNDLTDDTLLLSLQKRGQDIGTIGDGTFAVKLVTTAGAGSNTGVKLTNPLITNTSGYWVMNRYWQVTPTHEPAKSVGVRFYYNNQDLKDVNGSYPTHNLTNNKLIFYKAVGGNPDPTTNLAGATKIISILPGTVASDTSWTYHELSDTTQYGEYSVGSFSGGGGGGTGNNEALPITLINFTGQLTHNNALLNWQTATEINTAYFNVQRSVDGVVFSTVGKVTAAGNSTTTQDYQFTDALASLNPLPSQLFYRLQVADKDGAISYSKIIVLNVDNTVVTLIYPNPVHNTLNVRLNGVAGKVSITIVNAEGKLLQNQQFSSVATGEAVTINTSTLAAGIYILHVQYDGKSVVQKFVKY